MAKWRDWIRRRSIWSEVTTQNTSVNGDLGNAYSVHFLNPTMPETDLTRHIQSSKAKYAERTKYGYNPRGCHNEARLITYAMNSSLDPSHQARTMILELCNSLQKKRRRRLSGIIQCRVRRLYVK